MDEKEAEARPVMGTIFLVQRAKRSWLTDEKNLKIFFNKYSLENRKCLEMPRAYVRPTTLMRMNNSYKMRVDDRRCPVRNVC